MKFEMETARFIILPNKRRIVSKFNNNKRLEKKRVSIILLINIFISVIVVSTCKNFANAKSRKVEVYRVVERFSLANNRSVRKSRWVAFLWLPKVLTEWMGRQFALPFSYLCGATLIDPFFVSITTNA